MTHYRKRFRGGVSANEKGMSASLTLDAVPFSQMVNNARHMVAGNEIGENRRAPAYVKRLHPAKYIKCDPMMKELFFPLLTMAKRFGFCSTTGMGSKTAAQIENGQDTPADVQGYSRANGCYRGIAMFTLRSHTIDDASIRLTPDLRTVGSTMASGTSQPIRSPYIRFNNGPAMQTTFVSSSGGSESSAVYGGGYVAPSAIGAPTVSASGPTQDELQFNQTKIHVSECGDIQELETKAVQSVNFQHAVGSATSSEGTTTLGVQSGNPAPNWNGTGSVVNSSGTYYANLKNTTIRIADGYLELDITNGKSQSTFIEVVIHAHKKHASNIDTQDLLDAVVNAVQYQQTDRNVSAFYSDPQNQQNPGGWQALWDPTYPLLGCKSQHRKPIDDIAREVHRSNHMLSAGQSKTVKIFLGNLYYDLGSKCTASSIDGGDTDSPNGFISPGTGVGALNIAVGHSGVLQLTAPTNGGTSAPDFSVLPDTYNATSGAHTIPGTGFWVGKQFCPSEIVVNGNYVEKFYPAYVVDKERRNWTDRPMMPPSIPYGYTLPAGQPVQEVLGTVDATNPVPANITTAFREEL